MNRSHSQSSNLGLGVSQGRPAHGCEAASVRIGGLWKRSQGVSRFTKPNYKHRVFILTDQALSYYQGTIDVSSFVSRLLSMWCKYLILFCFHVQTKWKYYHLFSPYDRESVSSKAGWSWIPFELSSLCRTMPSTWRIHFRYLPYAVIHKWTHKLLNFLHAL